LNLRTVLPDLLFLLQLASFRDLRFFLRAAFFGGVGVFLSRGICQ
jgi:hypothetical protein